MMKYVIAGVMSVVVYSGVPVAVSAETVSYRGAGYGVSQGWFERNSSLYNVFTERFGVQPDTSYYSDTVRDRASKGSEKSDDSMSKDDHNLAPSSDISPSVHGQPGWDRQLSGDPSVRDLSRMDGGGFAPPGSYTGSERRP